MMTESAYRGKFSLLQPFAEEIFRAIKKEIKSEMAGKNSMLRKKVGVLPNGVETKELSSLFLKNIITEETEEGEELGEWVASVWINKRGEIFKSFHNALSKISDRYDTLTSLPEEVEKQIFEKAVSDFGALDTYIFAVLNSVVFSEKTFEKLAKFAQTEAEGKKTGKEGDLAFSVEKAQKNFERQIEKIIEKYENRLLGVTKRHQMEVAGYRKQISGLQKKLDEVHAGSR